VKLNGKIKVCSSIVLLSTSLLSTTVFAEELPNFTLAGFNVTAQGYKKTNLETAADTVVYSAENLKKTGAADVLNALKYKAGIYYTNMGPNDQNWITGNSQVNLRGIDGGTLILVNGVPVSFNNVSHLDMMNLDEVERVEVVKGGGSVLYGSEALGGVINIITKDEMKNTVHVATGNQGQRNYSATIGAGKLGIAAGRTKYGATGNMTDSLGTKTISGSKIPYYIGFGDSTKDYINLNYKFNENWKLTHIYNKKEYSTNYNDAAGNVLQHFMYDDTENYTQLAYKDENGWDSKLYYNSRKIENPDYFTVNPSNLEWEKSTHKQYGIINQKKWTSSIATSLLGFSLKRETYENDNQKFATYGNSSSALKSEAHFGEYSLNEYSLFGSYDRKLSSLTNAIFSFREDAFKSDAGDYNAFLPQFQIITKLNGVSSLYASVGKSFRMPTFRNLYYSSAIVKPNPDLKPEHGWNYETGYKYEHNGKTFNVSLFKTEIEDQIVAVKGSDGVSYQTNAAQYKNAGLEVRYTQAVNKNLSYNLGAVLSDPQRIYKEGQDWQRTLGKYQVNGGINYSNKGTDVSLNLSYWTDRVKNGVSSETITVTDIDSPLLISSLHVGHKINKNVEVTFNVENLFNRKDIANVGGTSNNNLYYTMGRTYVVGMNYSF